MGPTHWHYFIGDIHGCYMELLELEDQIVQHATKHNKTPIIVSVGDLVDRGPDSNLVVAHLRAGVAEGSYRVVLGNHDIAFLSMLWAYQPWSEDALDLPAFCDDLQQMHKQAQTQTHGFAPNLPLEDYMSLRRFMWIGQGGAQTLASYDCDPHAPDTWKIDSEDLHFLLNCPLIWENETYIVTHALATQEALDNIAHIDLHARQPDARNTVKRAAHTLTWNRSTPQHWSSEKIHISGHSVVARPVWKKRRKMLQIDTGCVFGQKLTAWCPEAHKFLHVKAFHFI